MSALICDICGGNLVMDASGEFAVCESCGMKHSKDRVKVKVQEIKGVVELTKGDAEKERLLKNAETLLKLEDLDKAKLIYEQLINEYPDDYQGYLGLAKIEFIKMPLDSNNSGDSFKIREYQEKCIRLNPSNKNEFNKLRKEYQERSMKCANRTLSEIAESIKAGELTFHKLGLVDHDFLYVYNPPRPFYTIEDCSNILNELHDNAKMVISELQLRKQLHKLNNLVNLKHNINTDITFTEYQNNRTELASYRKFPLRSKLEIKETQIILCETEYEGDSVGILKDISDIIFLSPLEAIVEGVFERRDGDFFRYLLYIQFEKPYTTEELLNALNTPTLEEQRNIWSQSNLCESCGSQLDHNLICAKCHHMNKDKEDQIRQRIVSLIDRQPDQLTLMQELHTLFPGRRTSPRSSISNYKVLKIEDFEIKKTTSYSLESTVSYTIVYQYKRLDSTFHYWIKIPYEGLSKLIDFLSTRTPKNECQFCGGAFKGFFKEYCSKCGKPKNF